MERIRDMKPYKLLLWIFVVFCSAGAVEAFVLYGIPAIKEATRQSATNQVLTLLPSASKILLKEEGEVIRIILTFREPTKIGSTWEKETVYSKKLSSRHFGREMLDVYGFMKWEKDVDPNGWEMWGLKKDAYY